MSEYVVDFPTMGDLADRWLEVHARVPNGFMKGRPFSQSDWQFWCTANFYRVRDGAVFVHPSDATDENPVLLNQAFVYRRAQVVAPQKTGKGPWTAAIVALEAVGPSVFAGWAEGGEVYRCAEFGCPCGWGEKSHKVTPFRYEAGEPMGMRHPSPLIQLTANSEEQVKNVYRPLSAMIRQGPLSELMLIREGFIRIVGESGDDEADRIDVVSSSARSRLGNPISFAVQDESGTYTATNKMVDVAETQRRSAAGMGGRTLETTNAWNPVENSTAQRTFEAKSDDVFKFFRQPPAHLSYKNKRERRQIHEHVYKGSPWVDLNSIEAEAAELMQTDSAQAERFFGNRLVAGDGHWMDMAKWGKKADKRELPLGSKVCLGFDGSDNDDFTGIRLETLTYYQFTPTYGAADRQTLWEPKDWNGRIPRDEVRAAVEEICSKYNVIRAYLDPKFWETEIDEWAAKYGEKVFVKWPTNTIGRMWPSLERFRGDVYDKDARFRHDDDPRVSTHVANAVIRARGLDPATEQRRYFLGKLTDHQKFDFAMSSVLAHEAVCDAIAGGALEEEPDEYVYF